MPICVAGEKSDQSRALEGSGLRHLAPVPTAAPACSVEYVPFAKDYGGVAVDNRLAHYKSTVPTFSVFFRNILTGTLNMWLPCSLNMRVP
jgi:hypothetical protein